MASNDQKTVLPSRQLTNTTTITTNILPISRGEQLSSARVDATIIVSDVGNENAQIVLTQLPKAPSSSSKAVKQNSKTLSPSSTSGAMTGDEFLLCSPLIIIFCMKFFWNIYEKIPMLTPKGSCCYHFCYITFFCFQMQTTQVLYIYIEREQREYKKGRLFAQNCTIYMEKSKVWKRILYKNLPFLVAIVKWRHKNFSLWWQFIITTMLQGIIVIKNILQKSIKKVLKKSQKYTKSLLCDHHWKE